ncbi:hypothetical protein G6F40_015420 [Rhizopus arrhizus]|nr:hypothetical protein G6F40_015420 [Rhizopus arrhizus]
MTGPVPGRTLPQHHHRRRVVRLPGRLCLLVPEGVRLHPQRAPGQVVLRLLGDRLLPGLHAAVHARLHGHDPAHEPVRQPGVDAVPDRRLHRCTVRVRRHHPDAGADLRERARPQAQPGPDRRPVGRPYAGVGNLFAAGLLQLRHAAGSHRAGRFLGAQAAW